MLLNLRKSKTGGVASSKFRLLSPSVHNDTIFLSRNEKTESRSFAYLYLCFLRLITAHQKSFRDFS